MTHYSAYDNAERMKIGLMARIMRLGAQVLCLEAQKDYAGALERNVMKTQLLRWLELVVTQQLLTRRESWK